MDSFAAELQIPFPMRLENPHVIAPSQVRVYRQNMNCIHSFCLGPTCVGVKSARVYGIMAFW